jgi:hypothetical protein
MMEAASTSETSVNFYQATQHNNPEDSHLHTYCRENLKSHYEMDVQVSFIEKTFREFSPYHHRMCMEQQYFLQSVVFLRIQWLKYEADNSLHFN